MRVVVINDLSDLEGDLRAIPVEFTARATPIVRRHVNEGVKVTQRIAREKSGPHGVNYFKRITGEMTGPLTGEFGPHDGGTPVGAGWRHGAGNNDTDQAADLIGPKFAETVLDVADGLFWP